MKHKHVSQFSNMSHHFPHLYLRAKGLGFTFCSQICHLSQEKKKVAGCSKQRIRLLVAVTLVSWHPPWFKVWGWPLNLPAPPPSPLPPCVWGVCHIKMNRSHWFPCSEAPSKYDWRIEESNKAVTKGLCFVVPPILLLVYSFDLFNLLFFFSTRNRFS